MSRLSAPHFPERAVRDRARKGTACAFPPITSYGTTLFGASGPGAAHPAPGDLIDAARLVPPIFMDLRLEKLIELGREPMYGDVELSTEIGGFTARAPLFVSAFGSTQIACSDLGMAVSRQAGRLGIPMVIGENIVPVNGYGRIGACTPLSLLGRVRAYGEELEDGLGGVAIQQSTEDADAEVWNLVYSDPSAQPLLNSGRLAFELKVGQGAKPGIGGMTVLPRTAAAAVSEQYTTDQVFGDAASYLRSSSPGTYTEEILRQQIHLMRNNFPRARVWVKLHPGRDVRRAAAVAWRAGAHSVTVDGAEGGTGWAPTSFMDHVGLPLGECLRAIGRPPSCLLATGRMWEGTRAVKCLALGARGVGLGRAALLAVDEDPDFGLQRLVECMELEMRMLISALGKYEPGALGLEDLYEGGAYVDDPREALAGYDASLR
ncbi:glutamate synthase-related protein [Sphaerisporangium sp. TRM90804]|uniref:glutamate synthase-related protein n=1 Tax=Sphaerisporangium sp. TRM90804 TaxID=3031113 RepID=UPI00244AD736|nr:glutamate synthase-related protein [Sphaerisporangium sp. TRM90804]MDH2427987.1 glutamate synthase-related protein [Sphaerisporangium sp. TRM90804]